MQTRTQVGSVALIAAIGMTLGAIGGEIGDLQTWAEAVAPAFVGSILVHLGSVVAAFVGGQLIPSSQKLLPPSERK